MGLVVVLGQFLQEPDSMQLAHLVRSLERLPAPKALCRIW
jgi:hypothetical protein